MKSSVDAAEYRGSFPRNTRDLAEWHAAAHGAEVLEPELPILDAHHHLFGTLQDPLHYRIEELQQDVAGGHRVVGTIYVEAYEAGWRKAGPEALRPVGEVERIVDIARNPIQTPFGECHVAAGVVSYVDLALGDGAAEVLEEQMKVADRRLRGVRHRAATVEGKVGAFIKDKPRPNLMAEPAFRRGFAHLERYALSFDAWVYHTQLGEVVELADAFPNTTIVLDHVGAPLGVAEWVPKRTEVLAQWRKNMRALADRPNVRVKVGGMGMTVLGFGFERQAAPAMSNELATAWQPFIETCIEMFGTKRCMLESNFPVDKQSCSYVELWNAFKLATRSLSPNERSDLFCGTACRTYRLPKLFVSAVHS